MNPAHSGHSSFRLLCSVFPPLLCFFLSYSYVFSPSPPLLWLPPPVLPLMLWLRLDVVSNIKQVICLCLQPLWDNNGSKSYKWLWFTFRFHTWYAITLSLSSGTGKVFMHKLQGRDWQHGKKYVDSTPTCIFWTLVTNQLLLQLLIVCEDVLPGWNLAAGTCLQSRLKEVVCSFFFLPIDLLCPPYTCTLLPWVLLEWVLKPLNKFAFFWIPHLEISGFSKLFFVQSLKLGLWFSQA